MQIVNDFKICLISEKAKKTLCGVFYGRGISEFNSSCYLDQRHFV